MDITESAVNSSHGSVTVVSISGTPVSSINPTSAFRMSTYDGVKHGVIPTNVVDTKMTLLAKLVGQSKARGDGGGFIKVWVNKIPGIEFQDQVCMDAASLLLNFLQVIDPTIRYLCTMDSADLPPITDSD